MPSQHFWERGQAPVFILKSPSRKLRGSECPDLTWPHSWEVRGDVHWDLLLPRAMALSLCPACSLGHGQEGIVLLQSLPPSSKHLLSAYYVLGTVLGCHIYAFFFWKQISKGKMWASLKGGGSMQSASTCTPTSNTHTWKQCTLTKSLFPFCIT